MKELTPEETKRLQKESLKMALYFKEFCEENNLMFYFCGGCCIGTIRHHGFIPWDDDVDFFMPRDDYEKLLKLWDKKADTSRYTLVKQGENLVDHNLFATIRDNKTTFIKPYQKDIDMCHGVPLDILPIDGYPDSTRQRRFQVFWALVYSLYCAQLVPENHGKGITLLGKIALGIIKSKKLRYKIWKFAERHMTKYPISQCSSITELCSGPVYMKNRYPKEIFASAVYKEFEGHEFPLPVGYDEYLKIVFGDYMQLPPKDKQVAHHDAYFYDLDNSYLQYKGKYYCNTEENL